MEKKQTFIKRNIVAIVIIPAIIGLHYGWNLMQNNRTLVPAEDQIDLPVVTFAKYCWRKLTNETKPSESAASK